MTKERFIRLDMSGHWKGNKHCSSMCGDAGEWDENSWETNQWGIKGISCYSLEDVAYALDSLKQYWEGIAMMKGNYTAPVEMQVTIFLGEKIGMGADHEDLAICEKTLMQFPAQKFMENIIQASDDFEFEHDNAQQYKKELLEIAKKYNI